MKVLSQNLHIGTEKIYNYYYGSTAAFLSFFILYTVGGTLE
jgi:hypothetical protein